MKNPSLSACCFVVAGFAFASSASADLSYTQTSESSMPGMANMAKTNVKFYSKGLKQRIDANVMGSNNVTLMQCGSIANTQIDTKNRVYTVYPQGMKMPKMPAGQKPMAMTMNFKVTNLGTDTINGQKAPHYRINMAMKMNGRPMNVQTEIWSSKTPMPTCAGMDKEITEQLTKNLGMLRSRNIKINGDLKSLGSVYRMVPLRQKISMGGMALTTINTTKISTAPVSNAIFSIPAGYRKVSNTQYQAIQQKAMQAQWGELFKSVPKMGR